MNLFNDLKDSKWIYLKAALFAVILLIASIGLLIEAFSWQRAFLVAVLIWSSARLYYFMFYVIERYVDPDFRFSGIGDFLLYLLKKRG